MIYNLSIYKSCNLMIVYQHKRPTIQNPYIFCLQLFESLNQRKNGFIGVSVYHQCIVLKSRNMLKSLQDNIKPIYFQSTYQWGSAPRWQLQTAPPLWSRGEQSQTWSGVWCHRPPSPRGHCGSNSELWCGNAPDLLCPTPASAITTPKHPILLT